MTTVLGTYVYVQCTNNPCGVGLFDATTIAYFCALRLNRERERWSERVALLVISSTATTIAYFCALCINRERESRAKTIAYFCARQVIKPKQSSITKALKRQQQAQLLSSGGLSGCGPWVCECDGATGKQSSHL